MMRIAKPDSEKHLVVPVWDFYGRGVASFRGSITDEDKDKLTSFYGQSFLTINAIDGTIINRELRY